MKLLSDAFSWMTRDPGLSESASQSVRFLVRIFLWLLLVVVSGCSISAETKAEEGAWFALQMIDTAQTANIESTPGVYERESQWAIGREPKRRDAYAYMGTAAVLHVGAAVYMDAHHWPRWVGRLYEAVTIADSANCVQGNYRLGLATHF